MRKLRQKSGSAAALSPIKRALLEKRLRGEGYKASAIARQRTDRAPLSFAQRRLWFLCSLRSDDPAYNIPVMVRLCGRLDIAALERAINELVRRHEILRTGFLVVDGEPIQRIEPELEIELPLEDLSGRPDTEKESCYRSRTLAELRQPFDLERAPLLRARLFRLNADDARTEHVLSLVFHHIVFDGWSAGILCRELTQIYLAFTAGRMHALPEPPIQYSDFARWQLEWLRGNPLERQLAYWMNRLEGVPHALDLPTDYPRPRLQTYSGATYSFTLPSALTRRLKDLSLGQGSTLFVTLLSAFAVLLYRITGQTDFCIGLPVANRNRVELEGLIGFFVNTLAFRADLGGRPTFAELLERVHRLVVEDQQHQDLPFEYLVEKLKPTRDPSRSPLFQVMLVLHNLPIRTFDLPELSIHPEEPENPTAKFDLTLHLTEEDGGLRAGFEYSTDLFAEGSIAGFAEGLHALLEACAEQPARRIDDIPLLTPTQFRGWRLRWNSAGNADPCEWLVHERIGAQAEKIPDALAVAAGGHELTYAELNAEADRLAHRLRRLGVGPEVRVAVCLHRSPALIVGILAVLKAGGAYVPIDPGYPAQRIADVIEDCQASVLVTEERVRANLPEHRAVTVDLDRDRAWLSESPVDRPFVRPAPDNLAYVIYTSGSTGRPKGVAVTHGNLARSTYGRFVYYQEPVTGFLLVSPAVFDSSVAGLFWTLVQGGCVYLPEDGSQGDPAHLVRLIEQYRLTHLLCLPSLYGLLLEQAGSASLASLRTVIVAGEACPGSIVERHYAKLPEVRMYNEYGPTEGTVWSTVHLIEPGEKRLRVPIGRPTSSVRIHILDRRGFPVPVGVPGEIHIGGEQLARGYLGRSDLTAERFTPDPFVESEASGGSRLYRTGDLARYREDGAIEFLGRRDHQVKIRGYRIELEEIEARLLAHPNVKEAAVLVREDSPVNPRLVAYLTLRGGEAVEDRSPAVESVRAALEASLPEYMVPAAWVVVEVLPKTPNGKLDRAALPAPARRPPEPAAAPRNALEARLAELWREVLGVESVGIYDNFFNLGGHSMLAVQLMFKVREAFGIEMPLSTFFERPTVERQARLLGGDEPPLEALTAEALNLEEEAELDFGFDLRSAGKQTSASPSAVLLTGATGFLGAYLLRDLLQATQTKIYCLVRAGSLHEAAARLSRALDPYELRDLASNPRVTVLCGDLTKPFLGIPPDRFASLSREIGAIYHNGAAVDFTASYETLKPCNVSGTREVLRFAGLGTRKAVHYVSTVSVFGENPPPPSGFTEEDFPLVSKKLIGGYAQSKWVAERMVRIAAERGLPVTIHRPSTIFGDSRSGVCNIGDVLCRMIKGCIELGSAPDIDEPLNVVPVDYVSTAIVFLGGQPNALGKTFHLTSTETISARALIDGVREFGYPVEIVPSDRWVRDTTARIKHQPDHVLFPLLPMFEEWLRNGSDSKNALNRYDCRSTVNALRQGNIVHPCDTETLIRVVLSGLVRRGSLPVCGARDRANPGLLKTVTMTGGDDDEESLFVGF